jgi:hypothetical protein
MPKALLREARVIWRRPDCLKPSLQWCKRHTLRHGILGRSHRHQTAPSFVVPTLPAGGRQAASLLKGTDRVAYVTLDTSSARGIRDRLRDASPMATECP